MRAMSKICILKLDPRVDKVCPQTFLMNILDLRRPLQMFQDNYQIKIRVALLNNILDKSRVNFETFSTIHEIVSL